MRGGENKKTESLVSRPSSLKEGTRFDLYLENVCIKKRTFRSVGGWQRNNCFYLDLFVITLIPLAESGVWQDILSPTQQNVQKFLLIAPSFESSSFSPSLCSIWGTTGTQISPGHPGCISQRVKTSLIFRVRTSYSLGPNRKFYFFFLGLAISLCVKSTSSVDFTKLFLTLGLILGLIRTSSVPYPKTH